jgi:hypothetical protein
MRMDIILSKAREQRLREHDMYDGKIGRDRLPAELWIAKYTDAGMRSMKEPGDVGMISAPNLVTRQALASKGFTEGVLIVNTPFWAYRKGPLLPLLALIAAVVPSRSDHHEAAGPELVIRGDGRSVAGMRERERGGPWWASLTGHEDQTLVAVGAP